MLSNGFIIMTVFPDYYMGEQLHTMFSFNSRLFYANARLAMREYTVQFTWNDTFCVHLLLVWTW